MDKGMVNCVMCKKEFSAGMSTYDRICDSCVYSMKYPIIPPPGRKDDAGKIQPRLVLQSMSGAVNMVCQVATKGAIKYTPDGWKDVPDGINRYTDALYRHLLREPTEYLDQELQLPHAAMVAWNALARLQLILNRSKN